MNSWSYPFFSRKEMQCKGFEKGLCVCGGVIPKDEFMQILVTIREEVGFPLMINSGARCEEYNAKIGGEKNSAHVLGLAADVSIYGAQFVKLFVSAVKHGMLGIGISQKDGSTYSSRFMHVDKMQRDWVKTGQVWSWSY